MKANLRAFDYILANRAHCFLVTKEEKVAYFTGELGIGINKLPTRIYRSGRSNSQPIRTSLTRFRSSSRPNLRPLFSSVGLLCPIYEGVFATPGFEMYLYGPVQALGRFTIVYVATKERWFPFGRRTFQRFFSTSRQSKVASNEAYLERLLDYFRLEHLYGTKQFELLDAANLKEWSLRKKCRTRNLRLFLRFGRSLGKRL
jgi:hypothetical protein